MNIRQLDTIISKLLRYKHSPMMWDLNMVHKFCEDVGIYWATQVVTIQSIPKQRSHTISVDQRKPTYSKRLIPILDACMSSYEHILEVCDKMGVFKMITHQLDVNMYFQIQKLKIWSFILQQYQNNREYLKTKYINHIFTQQSCKSCSAEHCVCEKLQLMLTQIEIYIKSIYVEKSQGGHISFLDINNIRPIIEQKQSRKRDRSVYINQDIVNLVFKNIIIKHEDYFTMIYQNQLDGFILLNLVNPPFKDENLFLKCILLGGEIKLGQMIKLRVGMQGNTMTQANRYYCINNLVMLLHHILSVLSLTIYKNNDSYNEYLNHMGQRKVKLECWQSLYFFPQAKFVNDNIKQRQISSLKTKSVSIARQSQDGRRPSKSYGELEQKDFSLALENLKKQTSIEQKIARNATQTLDDGDLREIIRVDTNSSFSSDRKNIANVLNTQILLSDSEEEDPNRGSVMMQQEADLTTSVNLIRSSTVPPQSEQLQQSVYLQQSILMQSKTLDEQKISTQNVQNPEMQESTLMQSIQQSQLMQSDYQIQQPELVQQSSSMKYYILFLLIDIGQNIQDRILKLTPEPVFDPFSQIYTHIKLKFDEQAKEKTVQIYGATIGRNEDNTFAFTDHQKISGKHAKIYFENNNFYLKDLGSKGGTFIKVRNNFMVEPDMSIYVGNKFAFKVVEMTQQEDYGNIKVKFEKEGQACYKVIQLKKGDKFSIGKDKQKNNITFQYSQCNKLLSARHMDIFYEFNFKLGQTKLMISDLNSKNGTWLRLSEKLSESRSWQLSKGTIFNLSFELMFEITENVCDQ
ncbi:hypothetical protein pb186bvf_006788 [Paramecium bursaria]